MPVNSIVIAACLEWMERHTPPPEAGQAPDLPLEALRARAMPGPRWATISRAMRQVVSHGRPSATYPFDRFTDPAKQMLQLAQSEAQKAGRPYIGTEHVLVAAFGDPGFYSARILAKLGVDEKAVSQAIDRTLKNKRPKATARIIPTSQVKRVVEIAFNVCGSMGDVRVGTHHMLLALASEGDGIAARILNDAGATKEAIAAQMRQLTEPEA